VTHETQGSNTAKKNYFKEEILKLISFYRLPRALSLFLDKK